VAPRASRRVDPGGVMAYAVTLNGVTAGQAEPMFLQSLSGLGQTARTGRTPLVTGGRAATGGDVSEGRDIVCEIGISADDPVDVEGYIDELVAAWAPSATDTELTVQLARGARLYPGRPTGIDVDPGMLPNGAAVARCTFEAFDARWYSSTPKSVTVLFGGTSGGLDTPFVTPFVFAGSGSTGDALVVNDGTAPSEWSATISGPVTSPRLILGGKTVQLDADIAEGTVVTVDSRTGSVVVSGAARPWVALSSVWWQIPPGSSTFSARATAGTGSASLTWRDGSY
jgi:hypothetical protein